MRGKPQKVMMVLMENKKFCFHVIRPNDFTLGMCTCVGHECAAVKHGTAKYQ